MVDEDSPFRNSLVTLLKNQIPNAVIATADTSRDARLMMVGTPPRILLVNIHLSKEKGLAFAAQSKERHPNMTILAMAEYDYPEYHVAVHRSGIDYFIPKDQWPGNKLVALVDSILTCEQQAPLA